MREKGQSIQKADVLLRLVCSETFATKEEAMRQSICCQAIVTYKKNTIDIRLKIK